MKDWKISLKQLRALRNDARMRRDAALELRCDRALDGDEVALALCAELVASKPAPFTDAPAKPAPFEPDPRTHMRDGREGEDGIYRGRGRR